MLDEVDLKTKLEKEIEVVEAESRNLKTRLLALQLELARATADDITIDAKLASLRKEFKPELVTITQTDMIDSNEMTERNIEVVLNTADHFRDAVDKIIALAQCYKVELDGATNAMEPGNTQKTMMKWEQILICLGHHSSLPAIADTDIFLEGDELANGIQSFLDGYPLPVEDFGPAALYFKTISAPEKACPEWIQSAASNCTRDTLGYFGQSIQNVSKLPTLTTRQAIFILRGIDLLQSTLKSEYLDLVLDLLDNLNSLPPSAVVNALWNFLSHNSNGWYRSRGWHLLNFAPSYSPELMPGVKVFSEPSLYYIAREGSIIEFDGNGFDYAWNSVGQMTLTIHEEDSGFAGNWVIPNYTRNSWARKG